MCSLLNIVTLTLVSQEWDRIQTRVFTPNDLFALKDDIIIMHEII